jgi:hypothetical protein
VRLTFRVGNANPLRIKINGNENENERKDLMIIVSSFLATECGEIYHHRKTLDGTSPHKNA